MQLIPFMCSKGPWRHLPHITASDPFLLCVPGPRLVCKMPLRSLRTQVQVDIGQATICIHSELQDKEHVVDLLCRVKVIFLEKWSESL